MQGKTIPGYPSDHELFPLLTDESGALREGIENYQGGLYKAYRDLAFSGWYEHKPKYDHYTTDKDEIKRIVDNHQRVADEQFPATDRLLEEYLDSGRADGFPDQYVEFKTFHFNYISYRVEAEPYEDPELVRNESQGIQCISLRNFERSEACLKDLTGKGDGSALWQIANRSTPPPTLMGAVLRTLKRIRSFLICTAIVLVGAMVSYALFKSHTSLDGLLGMILMGASQLSLYLGGLAGAWFFLEDVLMNLSNIFADFSACLHSAQRKAELEQNRRLLYRRYRFCVLWNEAMGRRRGGSPWDAPRLLKRFEELLGIAD